MRERKKVRYLTGKGTHHASHTSPSAPRRAWPSGGFASRPTGGSVASPAGRLLLTARVVVPHRLKTPCSFLTPSVVCARADKNGRLFLQVLGAYVCQQGDAYPGMPPRTTAHRRDSVLCGGGDPAESTHFPCVALDLLRWSALTLPVRPPFSTSSSSEKS